MRDSAYGPVEIPADFWSRPDVTQALGNRDIGALFRLIKKWTGASQMRIGAATGNAQARVSAIANGKYEVRTFASLTRIADGLNMPSRARLTLGLAPADIGSIGIAPVASGTPEVIEAFPGPTQYPATTAQAVTYVFGLWSADAAQDLLSAPVDPGAWNAAALAWLVAEPDEAAPEHEPGLTVGRSDVTRIRAATKLFAQLDNRFGGALARQSLIGYLRKDASRLLAGRYRDDVGRDLFSAIAEAALLAAWASYDSGLHGVVQGYFVQALRLAEAGRDRRLGCSILSAMSHQATFLGHYGEAINLGRAARAGLASVATPGLTAQFLAMEARALAGAKEARGCQAALAAAGRNFAHADPAIDPEFISYFNEAELSAELAHCFRDLGDGRRAAQHAAAAEPQPDGEYARSDFFVTMVLADAYADQNDPEQACHTALDALRIGEPLTSARSGIYVHEFRQRLERFAGSQAVRDFQEQAAEYRLWTHAA